MQSSSPEFLGPSPEMERTDFKLYERNYQIKKSGIAKSLSHSLKTPYGQQFFQSLIGRDLNTLPFSDFLNLKQLTPEEFAKNPSAFLANEKQGYVIKTTGSTGSKKEIYYNPKSIVPKLGPALQQILSESEKPILFKDNDSIAVSVDVIKNGIEAHLNRPIETVGFTMPEDALTSLKESGSDTIYCTTNTSLATLLLGGWKKMYAENPTIFEGLKGKSFILELAGEAVTLDQLREWDTFLNTIFGPISIPLMPRISVIYGQAEQLMVGFYEFNQNDTEIKYKTLDHKFCMVVDKDGNPVVEQKGDIEVTNLNTPPDSSILIRYVSGDLGVVEFDSKGTQYLKDINRDPERAFISIMGEKLPLSSIPEELHNLGINGFQVAYQVQQSESHAALVISLLSETAVNDETKASTTKALSSKLEQDYPKILLPTKTGYMKLKIDFQQGKQTKEWKLLPPQNITDETFEEL